MAPLQMVYSLNSDSLASDFKLKVLLSFTFSLHHTPSKLVSFFFLVECLWYLYVCEGDRLDSE